MLRSKLNGHPTLTPFLFKRSPLSQSNHDKVVKEIAHYYHNQDKFVRADHINWIHGKPEQVGRHVPDVAVYNSTGIHNIEVETLDSCLDPHSLSQLSVFSRRGRCSVFVVIPELTLRNQAYVNKHFDDFRMKIDNLKLSNLEVKVWQL